MKTWKTRLPEESDIEYLKRLNDDERLAYILSQQTGSRAKELLRLTQTLMSSPADRVALANKVKAEWILIHDQGYNDPDGANELSKGNQPGLLKPHEQDARAQQFEESARHAVVQQTPQAQISGNTARPSFSIFPPKAVPVAEKADTFTNGDPATDPAAALAAGVAPPAGTVYKPGVGFLRPKPAPDKAEQLASEINEIVGPIKFKGPFAQYAKQLDADGAKQLYDEDSSVPFKGMVMPSGQTAFAIEQGDKLDKILKSRGISPLNASPADQAILKRADAAIRENQLQRLDFSHSAMMESEQKVMHSIDRFRKGSLQKALPKMLAATSPEDIKSVFDAAVSSGTVKRDDARADIKAIDKNFTAYAKAVETHAGNLVKDGQEDAALDALKRFNEKSQQMGRDGFLDELTEKGFSEKLKELNQAFAEMIKSLVQSILGSMQRGPQLKPE
jgi:Skp family chaperone for outer membrane proteins